MNFEPIIVKPIKRYSLIIFRKNNTNIRFGLVLNFEIEKYKYKVLIEDQKRSKKYIEFYSLYRLRDLELRGRDYNKKSHYIIVDLLSRN